MRNSGFKYLVFIFIAVLMTKGYSQDALEPNDSFASAIIRTITSYNTTYSSSYLRISTQNDLDYFKIEAGVAGKLKVRYYHPTLDSYNGQNLNYDIYLYNANQSQSASSTNGVGLDEEITYTISANSTWYVLVKSNSGYSDDASGYYSYSIHFSIEPPGDAKIEKVDFTYDDDSSGESTGNGDGKIQPNEIVEAKISIRNTGSVAADNIKIYLSLVNPGQPVTIEDSPLMVTSLAAGATNVLVPDFDLIIAASAAPQSVLLSVRITVNDIENNSWNESFAIQAASFAVTNVAIQVAPDIVTQNSSPSGSGSVSGFGSGSVQYKWITRRPDGSYADSGPLAVNMTNGEVTLPNHSSFPSETPGLYSTRVQVTSPNTYDSQAQSYQVQEAPHPIALFTSKNLNPIVLDANTLLGVNLNLQNTGNLAAQHGGFSISFQSITESDNSSNVGFQSNQADIVPLGGIDFDNNQISYYSSGILLGDIGGVPGEAQYLLMEAAADNWLIGETKNFAFTVRPKIPGVFRIYIRGWMSWNGYSSVSRDPSYSGNGIGQDQQTYFAYYYDITVNATQPDLIPVSISVPENCNTGETVPMSFSIKNQGNQATNVLFSSELRLSDDTNFDDSDLLLASRNYTSLEVGGIQSSGTIDAVIPADISAGPHYIGLFTDVSQKITESNEDNNILFKNISITKLQVDPPEFSPAPPFVFYNNQEIFFTCPLPDAVIRYTIDGSDPTESSPAATSVVLHETTQIKAAAFKTGMAPSSIVQGTYTMKPGPKAWGELILADDAGTNRTFSFYTLSEASFTNQSLRDAGLNINTIPSITAQIDATWAENVEEFNTIAPLLEYYYYANSHLSAFQANYIYPSDILAVTHNGLTYYVPSNVSETASSELSQFFFVRGILGEEDMDITVDGLDNFDDRKEIYKDIILSSVLGQSYNFETFEVYFDQIYGSTFGTAVDDAVASISILGNSLEFTDYFLTLWKQKLLQSNLIRATKHVQAIALKIDKLHEAKQLDMLGFGLDIAHLGAATIREVAKAIALHVAADAEARIRLEAWKDVINEAGNTDNAIVAAFSEAESEFEQYAFGSMMENIFKEVVNTSSLWVDGVLFGYDVTKYFFQIKDAAALALKNGPISFSNVYFLYYMAVAAAVHAVSVVHDGAELCEYIVGYATLERWLLSIVNQNLQNSVELDIEQLQHLSIITNIRQIMAANYYNCFYNRMEITWLYDLPGFFFDLWGESEWNDYEEEMKTKRDIILQQFYNYKENPGYFPLSSGYVSAISNNCIVLPQNHPCSTMPAITELSKQRGMVGDLVRITGSGFDESQNTTKVLFGDIPAKIHSWTDTAVETFVPAGAETNPISIVTDCYSVSSSSFQIYSSPSIPALSGAWSDAAKTATITEGPELAYENPYFEWLPSQSDIGIVGYSVSFVKDPATILANQVTQTHCSFTASGLEEGNIYYLKIKAQDNDGNWTSDALLFAYTYRQNSRILATEPAISLDFGEVQLTAFRDQTMKLYNLGSSPLTISSIIINGGETSNFVINTPPDFPLIINPSSKKSVSIRFAPTEIIPYSEVASIAHNSTTTGPEKSIQLSGEGIHFAGSTLTLGWTNEPGFESDGMEPNLPTIQQPLSYRVKFTDINGNEPPPGFPRVQIKKNGVIVQGSPFIMEPANTDDVTTGRIYQKTLTLDEAGVDYSYNFEAQDAEGNTATGEPVTARSFTVNNPLPVISSIDPAQKTINSEEFTLTVNGSNFVSTSVVRFNGSDRTTQFVSSTQLTATILAADLVTLGDYPITVINPALGGGTSVENVVLQVIEVPDNGPLAYYPFNNSANDESGNGNHGTNTGSPTPCADRFSRADKAYSFDGTDDAVVINMSAAMTSYSVGPHSYSVWVNRPAGSGDVEFIVDAGGASQDQRGVRYSSEGYPSVKWVISSSSVNTTATTVPSYNVWHHLAGVYTGTEVSLYVDGQLASSMPKSGAGNVLSIMKIGNISESANPNQNFTGKIDDVRIYNRALSFQEVLDLFNEPAESENHLPELLWTAETGYTADGLNPDPPDIVSPAVLRVKYRDADNNAPKDGYPKVHIMKGGVEISGSPFVMEAANSDAYSTGRIFQKSLTIATAGTDYSYVFEAQDELGDAATGEPVTARSFTVNNPLPAVSTIDPAQKTINSEEFTLTVNGSNFVSTSVVRFGGQDRATQFVSGTQLSATILAGDLIAAGPYPITVFNPAPGGGVSTTSVIFTVTLSPAGTLFAHYTLAGIGTDVSGNERHGTLFGPTPTADKSGEEGQALYFDGSDDYVDLPFSSQALGSAVTISAWVYRTGSSTGTYVQGIVSNDSKSDRGISIGAYPENGPTPASANKLQVSVYNDMNTSADLLGVVIPLSQWQFVTMVADGTNLKIYQDGQLQGSKPFSGNLRGSTNFHIGHDQYDEFSERYWHGTIDNVRFYDRALSAAEIAEIYALEGGTVVNHPPAVTALLPNSGSFKDPVFISATASDPDASDQVVAIKYEYNLGGTDWVAVGEDATPGDPLAWTSGLNWNFVNLRAKAFDGELWSTDWFVTMGSFTVDNVPPQFSGWMTAPADLSTSATGPLHVSVKVGDDFSGFGSNVPQLDYYLTGASYDGNEAMTQLDAATWIFDIPEPAGGWSAQGGKTLYFKAQAADELGNIAESTEQTRPVYSGSVPPLVHYDFDQNCLNKGTGGSGWDLVNYGSAYDASVVRLGTAAVRLTQSAASQQFFRSGNVTTELGEPFTISGWFKWDGSPFLKTSGLQVQASQQSVGAIMGQGDYPGDIPCEGSGSRHWALSLDTQNGKLGFVINSAGCGGEWQQNWSESQAVNANQWNWFCLSHDGSGVLSLYVNDVLAASRTDHVTGGGGEFNTGLYVGSGYYYYYSPIYPDYEVTTYFPGYLDDIRIYRRELTSAERSSFYHEGGWPLNTPPVVTALTPASGNHPDPVQLSALYADADAGDIISALQYQYSLDGSSGWTEIVEDATPADGFAWNSGMAGTALYLRARAFDGKEWGDWYTNSSPISIVEATTTHTLNLSAGWSMISSYVIPEDNALPVLCSDIAANMTILKNGAGNVYWPQFTINTIGAWNHLAGYQIHMKNPATLEVTGQAILPESTPISLIQGWNLIGYMRNTSQNVTTALSNVVSSMVIAKNGAGRVYWPAFSINTIGNMMPGEGYQLYTNQAATLTYAANSLAKDEGGSKSLSFASRHYQPCLVNSGRYWIIGIDGGALEEGDEVSAWTRSDRLLAAGAIAQGKTVLVIPGDDPMTEDAVEGCAEDERVVLRIWRRSDGMERPMDGWSAEDALTGVPLGDQLTYRTDAVTIVRTSASTLSTISGYRLEQNFPNPFNPETSIRFALPQAEDVRIVVMNLQGQQMRVLVDEQCAPGSHTIIWDGRDDYGQSVASGLYIVRMISGGFTANLKISFVK